MHVVMVMMVVVMMMMRAAIHRRREGHRGKGREQGGDEKGLGLHD
jgi:hypothetical protein